MLLNSMDRVAWCSQETGPQAQLTVQRGAPTQENAEQLPEGEARALLGAKLDGGLGRLQSCTGKS